MKSFRPRALLVTICCLMGVPGHGVAAEAVPRFRGSILFLMPHHLAGAYVPLQTMTRLRDGFLDLDYAKELVAMGFEIDYCLLKEVLNETCDPAAYNVLVLPAEPGAYMGGSTTVQVATDSNPQALWDVIKTYLDDGGGLLLSALETNRLANQLGYIGKNLGLAFPAEEIRELAPENQGVLPRFSGGGNLAYSSNLAPASDLSAVAGGTLTAGVTGIWYPVDRVYNNSLTIPLDISSAWVPLVRGTATSFAVPVNDFRYAKVPGNKPRATQTHAGGFEYSEQAPAIAAVRQYGGARVAVFGTWPIFHFGNGTKWQFNRIVLDSGVVPKSESVLLRSDYGKLLANTFDWLAQPTLASRNLFRTDKNKLSYPSLSDLDLSEKTWTETAVAQNVVAFDRQTNLYRGLIGLKSTFSGGAATIADFVTEAARSTDGGPVDFLVFLEDYQHVKSRFRDFLDEVEKVNARSCPSPASCQVRALPGYIIEHNLGGQMFFFGELDETSLVPSEYVMNDVLILQQGCDDRGVCDPSTFDAGKASQVFSWTLRNFAKKQAGFARFKGPRVSTGLKIQDLRGYGSVAVLNYEQRAEELELVEDATDQYLVSAAGTLPASPIAYAPISSTTALRRAVAGHRGLTYARATGLADVTTALAWWDNSSPRHVVASDGPVIELWTRSGVIYTEAADDGIPGRSLAILPLRVTAENRKLMTVDVYDGERLIRRYRPNSSRFEERLLISGALQHTLTVIAESSDGRRAVVAPSLTRKASGRQVEFCSDRLNDCDAGRLYRGPNPGSPQVLEMPGLVPAIGGVSWDGGPASKVAPFYLTLNGRLEPAGGPALSTDMMHQIPALSFADEGVVGMRSHGVENITSKLPVNNATQAWGPKSSAPVTYVNSNRIYVRPSLRPELSFFTRYPERAGPTMIVFRGRIFPAGEVTGLQSAQLMSTASPPGIEPGSMLIWKRSLRDPVETLPREGSMVGGQRQPVRKTISIDYGGWFGVYSPTGYQGTQIMLNRSEPIVVEIDGEMMQFFSSALQLAATYGPEAPFSYELLSLAFHGSVPVVTDPSIIERQMEYLNSDSSAQVTRGEIFQGGAGICSVRARDSAVAMTATRRKDVWVPLPVRVVGLNQRWSAGILMNKGHRSSPIYTAGPRYRALAFDERGEVHFPLPAWLADQDVWAGHPVVASGRGSEELIIEVTQAGSPDVWAIEVHNPTESDIEAQLRGNYPTGVLSSFSWSSPVEAGHSIHFWCESSCRQSTP
jgi:hypothetical protein